MRSVKEDIEKVFHQYSNVDITGIQKLPQSGSDRIYFRIETTAQNFIATFNTNVKENDTFIRFSQHFKNCACPVPAILTVNEGHTIYIQEDLGDRSLLNELEEKGPDEYIYDLFQKSLEALAHMQIMGDKGLNYDECITSKEFGKNAIISDLLYFKYYFLDTLKIPYDKEKLIDEFDRLATYLNQVDQKYFMFRDFQSRNVMVKDGEIYFIDYQGGMKGALQYDVASLLWQAKAQLSDEWKNKLFQYYMLCVEEQLQKPIDQIRFEDQYNGYVLIRLLQVLGAYGFRGLFERKAHFLTSIPLALLNLKSFLTNRKTGINLPEFERLLKLIISEELVSRFENVKAGKETPLIVTVNSFSYKKGIPADISDNGGGYVFDMRGILNPGRIEQYKTQNGLDKPVIDFLEQETDMLQFLNGVYSVIDISVSDYIKRDFKSLMINFGCTGGQHRSVYAAEAMARHLRNKFNVKIQLTHTNKDNWVK